MTYRLSYATDHHWLHPADPAKPACALSVLSAKHDINHGNTRSGVSIICHSCDCLSCQTHLQQHS